MSDILSLIYKIHAATGKDELWDDVMTDIGKLIPSSIVSLARHQFSTGFGHGVYTSQGGHETLSRIIMNTTASEIHGSCQANIIKKEKSLPGLIF